MKLCEAAIVDERSITKDGFDLKSCGQPAVRTVRILDGPQGGEVHPACQLHFEEIANNFPDSFEIVEEFGNVA